MYKYCIFDGQYLLTRNIQRLGSTGQNLSIGSVATSVLYSVAKLRRENIEFGKPVLLFDTYPYHKSLVVNDYKGDRHYPSEDELIGLDSESDASTIEEIKRELFISQLKSDTKEFIKLNFSRLGIPIISYPGYESDDLAYMLSLELEDDDCKSLVCSQDGDWQWFLNKNIDLLKFDGKLLTYDDFIRDLDPEILKRTQDLYHYKSIEDSAWGSHNNLARTIIPRRRVKTYQIMDYIKDDTAIDNPFSDRELFDKQLLSFKLDAYPDYGLIRSGLKSQLVCDPPMSDLEFSAFRSYTGFTCSVNYYSEYLSTLDKNLYV